METGEAHGRGGISPRRARGLAGGVGGGQHHRARVEGEGEHEEHQSGHRPVETAPRPGHPADAKPEGRHQSQGETDAVVAGKHRAHEASRRVALERAERRGSHDEREEAHGAEPDGDGGEGQVAHGATIGPTLAAATSHFKLTPAPGTSSIETCALSWRGWRWWP